MKVVLLNDTSLYSSHFGCQLVGQTFREQFKRTGMQLVASLPKVFSIADVEDLLSQADLLVINGEGSIHHGRNTHLLELAERYPTALMNCVFEDNPPIPAVKSLIYATARESHSADEIRKSGKDCDVVPDMIFASSMVRAFIKPHPSEELCITDSVIKTYSRVGPFKRRHRGDIQAHEITPAQYLTQLSQYQRVCAGRFHAAVVCSILEIPFSTWDSNTWKTRGMMEDMGVPHLHFTSREDALAHVPTEFDPRIREYAKSALPRIEHAFDQLKAQALRNYQDRY